MIFPMARLKEKKKKRGIILYFSLGQQNKDEVFKPEDKKLNEPYLIDDRCKCAN